MLKKMRWRFIGAAMAAFTAVVLTLLCFVNLWNYASVTRQQDATLDRLLEVDRENADVPAGKVTPPFENMGRYSPEVPYMIRFFSVHLSGDGTVERLSKLIGNLVTLSRLDEENPFPVRTEFSLSDALWEISEPFGSVSQAKGKNIRRRLRTD